MTTLPVGSRISLTSILYLTDFSAPSQAALAFGVSVAREYGAALHAFHVLTPTTLAYTTPELAAATLEAEEEAAEIEMQRIESQLAGVVHDTTVKRGFDIWPTIEDAILEFKADLIVLGTHGRTGLAHLLMGSVAEKVVRGAPCPVLSLRRAVKIGKAASKRTRAATAR